MDSTLETLARQADKALLAFLRAELRLGLTYANTAQVEAGFDFKGESRARQLAMNTLNTIERFRDRIADRAIQEELRKGALELARLLSLPSATL